MLALTATLVAALCLYLSYILTPFQGKPPSMTNRSAFVNTQSLRHPSRFEDPHSVQNQELLVHAKSCWAKKSKRVGSFAYYQDFADALRETPGVRACSSEEACINTSVFLIDSSYTTQIDMLRPCIRAAKAAKQPVVVFINKVYANTMEERLAEIRSLKHQLALMCSWSPFFVKRYTAPDLHLFWIPFGVQDRFVNLKRSAYKWDLGFSGNCDGNKYPARRKICQQFLSLHQSGVKLQPHMVKPRNIEKLEFIEHWGENEYMSRISTTKMWLSSTGFPGVWDLYGTRHFEIMASNTTLLLCDRCQLCDKLFTDGKHVVMFDDFTDFQQKVEYYMTHDNERMKLVHSAAELTVSKHLWKRRSAAFRDAVLEQLHHRSYTWKT